jgi:hypothetical protein
MDKSSVKLLQDETGGRFVAISAQEFYMLATILKLEYRKRLHFFTSLGMRPGHRSWPRVEIGDAATVAAP